ncbi:L-fuconolactonase [Knoellia remsis]|uniref:L-fuconolactonase n=1 Tax=Knoellia remsis TaxID=407159 RepID=A0A2T0U4L7_9MICO|nr:amidohydrolase family protein [Knoellia remsis]PRY52866.1 L-fuconolactonase [Knoellia remsis]
MRIDAHLHLWDPALGVYDWITPDLGPLNRAFGADEARVVLSESGIDGAVLVQAADAPEDTEAMLTVAAANPWVWGVVGWLDLEDPDGAARTIDEWSGEPHLRGVRQLVHDDPRPDVLDQPQVRRTLARLADSGLAFDVPDAFPRHLGQAASIARELPELTVVIDHLGKPPRGSDAMADWERQLRDVASCDNTVAKVSGLGLAGVGSGVEDLRGVWEVALDTFGPDRLMVGSDWPVSTLHGTYAETVAVLGGLVGELSPTEQEQVWWRTAQRTYRLLVPASPPQATSAAP